MGLLIEKTNVFTKWEIPLQSGEDLNDWEDNSWLVEHLRQLANKIEEENPRIINIGLRINCQYKLPNLYLELFEKDKI